MQESIVIQAGDNYSLSFTFTDQNGNAVDLTNGIVVFSVKKNKGDSDELSVYSSAHYQEAMLTISNALGTASFEIYDGSSTLNTITRTGATSKARVRGSAIVPVDNTTYQPRLKSSSGSYTATGGVPKIVSIITIYGPMEGIYDNYNDNSIDSNKWSNWGGGQVTESSGNMNLATTTSIAYYGVDSVERGNLVGSFARIKIVNAGNQSLASYEAYPIYLSKDSNNALFFLISGGTLYAYKKVSGSNTNLGSVAYNGTNHKYLRIRESGGTTYWEYSADGISWSSLYSESNPFTYTIFTYTQQVGTYAVEGSTTSLVLDDFNIVIVNKTITGKGRIEDIFSQGINGKGRIEDVVSQSIQGKGSISSSGSVVDQNVSGISRIEDIVVEDIQGKGRVEIISSQDIDGKGRVEEIVNQVIDGRGRIEKVLSQDVSGVGRIEKVVESSIVGASRVKTVQNQMIEGLGRIRVIVNSAILGKSRIEVIGVESINGVGRILDIVDQNISAKGRVEVVEEKNILGKGRIEVLNSESISGKGRIEKVVGKSIEGKGRVESVDSVSIVGKSLIISGLAKRVRVDVSKNSIQVGVKDVESVNVGVSKNSITVGVQVNRGSVEVNKGSISVGVDVL